MRCLFVGKGDKSNSDSFWGEPNTFWFCFDGIPKGSIVAVSTIGVRKEKSLFMQGYEEMMRKIKPKVVICYGEPFEEMKGKIITVDYAQTNNYKKHYTFQSERRMIPKDNVFDTRIKRAFGCVDVEKGRGSAGGRNISLPKNDSQLKHIFAERDGHVPDTPQNRKNWLNLQKINQNISEKINTATHGMQK